VLVGEATHSLWFELTWDQAHNLRQSTRGNHAKYYTTDVVQI